MALPQVRDATPLPVLLQLPHRRDATPLLVLLQLPNRRDATPLLVLLQLPHIRRTSSNCLDSTSGLLKKKNAERLVDGKVKPSSSETPFFASKLTFRYGETMNLC